MFQLDLKSRKSIYEQVIDNIKEFIISGILAPEEKLPSVRELSRTLTVNPNTVQKAYRELERQGYLYSVSGLGSFVAPREHRKFDEEKLRKSKETIGRELRELRYLGLSTDDVQKLIQELMQEGGYTI